MASLTPAALPNLVDGLEARDAANEEPMSVESLVDEIERPTPPTEHERKVEKEQNEKNAKGQVVDIARPSIEQRPDEARFLSEFASDGYLNDWGREFRGHDGIAQWNETDNIGRQARFLQWGFAGTPDGREI